MNDRIFWLGLTLVNLLLFVGFVYLLFVSGSLL